MLLLLKTREVRFLFICSCAYSIFDNKTLSRRAKRGDFLMQKGMHLIVALLLGVQTMKTGLCLSIRMIIDHTRWFSPTINVPFSLFFAQPLN